MRTSVAIIRGGAIGVAVAYFLRHMDPSVGVVVERDPRYTVASTPRASGGVRRLFFLPRTSSLELQHPVLRGVLEAMAVDGEAADIGFKQQGYLFIVPPAGREVLRRNFETRLAMAAASSGAERRAARSSSWKLP
jgi:glycine/D-amino acid oxidase-like deaminating enzyme